LRKLRSMTQVKVYVIIQEFRYLLIYPFSYILLGFWGFIIKMRPLHVN